jgi:uncharacterized protein (DUF302 family)
LASVAAAGIATRVSPYSVEETLERLTRLVSDLGLILFGVVDHSGEAAKVGLSMPDTKLVLFGSPVAGTPVMVAAPLAALDLPLKVLIWADDEGHTSVSYNTPEYLASRHGLTPELSARLAAIERVTGAIVSERDESQH